MFYANLDKLNSAGALSAIVARSFDGCTRPQGVALGAVVRIRRAFRLEPLIFRDEARAYAISEFMEARDNSFYSRVTSARTSFDSLYGLRRYFSGQTFGPDFARSVFGKDLVEGDWAGPLSAG